MTRCDAGQLTKAAAPGGAGGSPAEVKFRDFTGRTIVPARLGTAPLQEGGDGEAAGGSTAADATQTYLVPIGESPVYFEGGEMNSCAVSY
jgi:hypothetical protein